MDMVATVEIMNKMLSPSKCTKYRTESKSLASQVFDEFSHAYHNCRGEDGLINNE